MGQTELHQSRTLAHVFAVSAKEVTAEHPFKFQAQHLDQHLRTTHGSNLEKDEELGPEAPSPIRSAFVFVAGLIDIDHRLLRQERGQLMDWSGHCFTDLMVQHFGQVPPTDSPPKNLVEEIG